MAGKVGQELEIATRGLPVVNSHGKAEDVAPGPPLFMDEVTEAGAVLALPRSDGLLDGVGRGLKGDGMHEPPEKTK